MIKSVRPVSPVKPAGPVGSQVIPASSRAQLTRYSVRARLGHWNAATNSINPPKRKLVHERPVSEKVVRGQLGRIELVGIELKGTQFARSLGVSRSSHWVSEKPVKHADSRLVYGLQN